MASDADLSDVLGDTKVLDPVDAERLRQARPQDDRGLERALGLDSVMRALFADDASPRTLGPYELGPLLGRGGMGSVFRARDPRLERDVAIKVLSPSPKGLPADVSLEDEARAIARVDHPNVVQVFDVGLERGQVWIAMQLIEGGTARRWCSDGARDWRDVVDLMVEAGEGLAAAHARGVLHRDVKPDNILLDHHGRAKLADFGLAQPIRSGDPEDRLEAVLAGTPRYMAPELFEGQPASQASDQYAWTTSLAELLTGTGQRVPDEIGRVLERALLPDPALRWPSLSDVLDALRLARVDRGDGRERGLLLARVRKTWLEGVLDPAVDRTGLVALSLRERVDLVRGSVAPHGSLPEELDESGRALDVHFTWAGGRLALLAQAGGGKTTMMLAWVRLRLETAGRHADARVPVVFSLASFRGSRAADLDAWLVDQLVEWYRLSRYSAEGWVRGRNMLVVLDGLDEVPSGHRSTTCSAVDEWVQDDDVELLLLCRTGVFEGLRGPPRLRAALELPPLDDERLRRFGVDEFDPFQTDSLRAPLWASLAASSSLSNERPRLQHEHLARHLDRQLARGSGEEVERNRGRLSALARLLDRMGSSQLTLEELQFDSIPTAWGQRLTKAALALTLLVFFVGINVFATERAGRPLAAGLVFGTSSFASIWLLDPGWKISMVERLRWSWRTSVRRIPLCVGYSVPVGVLLGLVLGTPVTHGSIGLQYALLVCLVVGFEPSRQPDAIRPNIGFRTSLRNGLAIGLVTIVLFALFFRFVSVPMLSMIFEPLGLDPIPPGFDRVLAWEIPTIAASVVAAVYGLKPVAMHLAVRFGLAATTGLPVRLVPWLDDMKERGLLRRAGGSYLFMHATLREMLTHRGRFVRSDRTSPPSAVLNPP